MGTIGKVLGGLAALVLLVVAALVAVVHFYVTDERVRALVVPQAEKALGRQVSIGEIKVGLLSGITVHDLRVKEGDGQDDFISAGEFRLSYDLLPLLHKKIVVNEVLLVRPTVTVTRDALGHFNFETLAILEKGKKEGATDAPAGNASSGEAPPVALTVESVRVEQGVLLLRDAKKEIPEARVTSDLRLSLKKASGQGALTFAGDMGVKAELKYGALTPLATMKMEFDQDKLSYTGDLEADGEKVHIDGSVLGYMSEGPEVVCNLGSDKLNLDHLIAMADSLPKAGKGAASTNTQAKRVRKQKKEAIAKSLPPGLIAHGKIEVDQARYQQVVLRQMRVDYDLRQGIFTKKVSVQTAGGGIAANAKVDLNRVEPSYKGDLALTSINLQEIGADFAKGVTNLLSGALSAKLNFQGEGMEAATIKKSLQADGSYSLSQGGVHETPVSRAVAAVTGLSELQNLQFNEMGGKINILKGGKVRLTSSMEAANAGLDTAGEVDLDGNLNFPLTLKLSPELSQKMPQSGALGKFLTNDKGETELHLKVAGNAASPKVSLDTSGMQKQVEKAAENKAMEVLGGMLNSSNSGHAQGTQSGGQKKEPAPEKQAMDMLNGLFGK